LPWLPGGPLWVARPYVILASASSGVVDVGFSLGPHGVTSRSGQASRLVSLGHLRWQGEPE